MPLFPRGAARAVAVVLAMLTGGAALPAAADGLTSPPAPPATTDNLEGLPVERAEGAALRSAPHEVPGGFTMVSVDVPEGARVEVRTSADGARWSAWTVMASAAQEGDVADETDGGPSWSSTTEPLWVDEQRWLQTRVTGGRPEDVSALLIDTAGEPRSVVGTVLGALGSAVGGLLQAPAAEASTRPVMVARATWGAGPSKTPTYASTLRAGTLHHTAGSNGYTCDKAAQIVKGIWTYHTQPVDKGGRGWGDIGYNFLVDKCGVVYEGRAGGADRPVVGAHAGGFNTATFGVAILGDHQSTAPSAAALTAVAAVAAWKFSLHGIDPAARVTLTSGGSTRYARGVQVTLPTFFGHREVSATACPGDRLFAEMPALRTAIAGRLGAKAAPTPSPSPTATPSPSPTPSASPTPAPTAPAQKPRTAGQLVKRADGRVFYLSGGRAAHLADASVLRSWGWTDGHTVRPVPGQLEGLPQSTMWWRPGSLLRTPDGRRYFWDGSRRRPLSASVFTARGYNPRAVIAITASAARRTAVGASISARSGHLVGEVVRYGRSAQLYEVRSSGAGLRLRPVNAKVAASRYGVLPVAATRPASIRKPPVGGPIGFRPGNLLRTADGRVWFVDASGARRRVIALTPYGLAGKPQVRVTSTEAGWHPVAAALR